MPLWQRLVITVATMLLMSFFFGLLWRWLFSADIPSYLSGLVGGVTAIPMWEFLKRVGPTPSAYPGGLEPEIPSVSALSTVSSINGVDAGVTGPRCPSASASSQRSVGSPAAISGSVSRLTSVGF
jgi:hypothetical protein